MKTRDAIKIPFRKNSAIDLEWFSLFHGRSAPFAELCVSWNNSFRGLERNGRGFIKKIFLGHPRAFISSPVRFGTKLRSSNIFLFYEMVRNGISSIFIFYERVWNKITKFRMFLLRNGSEWNSEFFLYSTEWLVTKF